MSINLFRGAARGAAPPRATIRELALVAAWTAVATAVLHVGYLVARRALFGLIPFVGRDVVWMAPLGYLALTLPIALALAVLARLLPRVVTRRVATIALLAFGAFCLALLARGVHPLAQAVLALGAGFGLADLIERDRARWYRRMRWSMVAGAAPMLAIGLAYRASSATAEWRFDRTAPAAADGAPNLLLIILDTVRASSLSLYGYARATTPNIARFAAEGVVFDRAYSTAPWTLPSHASILTGRYPPLLNADWYHRLDGDRPVLAESYRRAGYHTVGMAANLLYTTRGTGLGRGFDRFESFVASPREVLLATTFVQLPTVRRLARVRTPRALLHELAHPTLRLWPYPTHQRRWSSEITRDFLDWQAREGDRPFFAMLNYFDAHWPYEPGAGWSTRFAARPGQRDLYDASIAQMDHSVGVLLDSLRARGVLDNTIVVITADHGEQFGEHGHTRHGNSVYLPLLHVPLVIRYPANVPAGRRVTAPVSLRDIAATVLELSGSRERGRFPGSSLAATWGGAGRVPRSLAFSELITPELDDTLRSVIGGPYHYLSNGDSISHLFSVVDDPDESEDLSSTPEGRAWIARFARPEAWRRVFDDVDDDPPEVAPGPAIVGRKR